MEFFRTELAFFTARSHDELGVGGKFLPRSGACQQFEKDRERFPIGDNLVDADDGDMQIGQGGTHAPVAFVGDYDQRARFSD